MGIVSGEKTDNQGTAALGVGVGEKVSKPVWFRKPRGGMGFLLGSSVTVTGGCLPEFIICYRFAIKPTWW